jgi:hypothetical protein
MCPIRSGAPPLADNHRIIRMSRIRSAGPPLADNHRIIRMSRIRSAGPPLADNKKNAGGKINFPPAPITFMRDKTS